MLRELRRRKAQDKSENRSKSADSDVVIHFPTWWMCAFTFHSYDDFSSWGVVKIGIQYYRPLIKIICRTAKHRTTSIPSEKSFLICSLLIIHSYYVCLRSIPVSPSQTCQPFLTKPRLIITLGLRRLSFFLYHSMSFILFFEKRGVSDVLLNLSWRQPRVWAGPSLINITLQTLSAPAPALHCTTG